MYRCDSRFHVEPVIQAEELFGEPFGIVVMTGEGSWIGIANGTRRDLKTKYLVSLPQKHGRGGQSAVRFGRLAEEARHNFVTRATELCSATFLDKEHGKPIVRGIVIGGNGELKHRLAESLPISLKSYLSKVVDLQYGGTTGFSALCSIAEQLMFSAILEKERFCVQQLEEAICRDNGLYVLGETAVRAAIESGAAHTVLLSSSILNEDESESWKTFATANGVETLQQITDGTPEGMRFVTGLTGVAALLRWTLCIEDTPAITASDITITSEVIPSQSTNLLDEYDFF